MDTITAITIMHDTWLQKVGLIETARWFNEFGLSVSLSCRIT